MSRCLQRLGISLDPARALAPLLPRLIAYRWPGNVRELENLSERIAVFLMQFDRLEDVRYDELRHDLPELFATDAPPSTDGQDGSRPSDARVHAALEASHGNRQAAARQLGISRSTLWRRMRERGVERPAT